VSVYNIVFAEDTGGDSKKEKTPSIGIGIDEHQQ